MHVQEKARSAASASLSQQAYDILRIQILRGDLPLGTPLSRRKLAVRLSMSLLPVGEALQRLEAEGLVESRARVGTRVRIPTEEDVTGHYILREALETMSARLYAERATEADKAEMLALAIDLDRVYEKVSKCRGTELAQKLFEAHQTHSQFHMRLAQRARCQTLCDAIERNQTLVIAWLFSSHTQFYRLPERWHIVLVEALNQGDIKMADRAMRKHVRFGVDQVSKRLARLDVLLSDAEQGFRVRG